MLLSSHPIVDAKPPSFLCYFEKLELFAVLQYFDNELLILLTGRCPSIICLQETFLKHNDNLNIRRYTMYNHIHQTCDRASGGSSIVINNSVPQSLIPLTLSGTF